MIEDKNTLIKLLEILDTCIKASSESPDITNVLNKIKNVIPFQAATIAIDTNVEFSLIAKQQIFTQNLPKEWQDIYFQRKFYNQDPVLAAILKTNSAVDWYHATSQAEHVNADFKNISQKHVGQHGLSILVKTKVGSTIISLVMNENSIKPHHFQLLEYIAPHVHEVFNRTGEYQRNRVQTPNLSKRELEVMNWAKQGKSNIKISYQLAISERTVKFHFTNIFNKLDVKNRSQAIAIAIRYGLIVA